jgi:hypothetical protein
MIGEGNKMAYNICHNDEMSCQGINVYTQTSSNFQPPQPYLVVV